MHVITIPGMISEPIPTEGGRPLEGGGKYICSNAFAGLMMLSRSRVVINNETWSLRLLLQVEPFKRNYNRLFLEVDWNGKHIWLNRAGGYGDILLLTPLIREIKALWPKCILHMACGKQHHGTLQGIYVIPELLPIPFDAKIDALIDFEGIIEGTPGAEKRHMAQVFADQAGITLSSLKPDYHITIEERTYAKAIYPYKGLPRIGIQFMASAYYRSYPRMHQVMLDLAKKAEVFLFGTPGQVILKEPVENVVNLMEEELTFRESAAVLFTCHSCVSPDSALVHLCSALDIPCVALYGPFPASLRVTGDEVVSLQGNGPCSPCFFHADFPEQFPAGMPCTKPKYCVVLDTIDPAQIVKEALSLTKGF